MRLPLALAAVAALVAAGCVTPASDLAPAGALPRDATAAFAAARDLLAGVPCEAKEVGAGTSENLLPLAAVAYDESMHGEVDVRGDWMLVARYQAGGFEVVDVSDPLAPRLVGTYQSEEPTAYDVKWMPDGRTAVVGHDLTIELVDVSPLLVPGLTPDEAEARGLAPVVLSTWTYDHPGVGANMHMLTTARIAEADWVFAAANDNTGVLLLKLEGTELKLVRHIGNDLLGGGPIGPHDMGLVVDETLQKPVLYVANGFEGWRAFDVSDPERPVHLATLPNLGLAQGYTHTVLGQKVGERRLVATIQEVGANTLSVFDATDFQRPVLLAQWRADATTPTAPQHNLQLVNGTLYVAHYTKGVYVFDLNKLGTAPLLGSLDLKPVAHYANPQPQDGGALGFANVWDVVVHKGLLYVADVQAGTAVVGYGCLTPGDEAATSRN
ncbi:MAG TPA: hypothetical protein VNX21_01675 [Candidatus Thermoplasmatota archaeon]|nr:hypothetical protein [Candidatus Thermoplasmatota archaeon]